MLQRKEGFTIFWSGQSRNVTVLSRKLTILSILLSGIILPCSDTTTNVLRSIRNYIWARTLGGWWNCLHSACRDQALPWSLCLPPLSSELVRTTNQAVISVSPFVFYSCLIFLPWNTMDWFWRFTIAIFSKSKYFVQRCHIFCPVLLLIFIYLLHNF